MIHEIVRNIIEAQKVDDWEPQFDDTNLRNDHGTH